MAMTYKRAPVPRKPVYSIPELAELLGVNKHTLRSRIKVCTEKPEPADIDREFKCSQMQRAERYYKAEFVAWHERNWGNEKCQS